MRRGVAVSLVACLTVWFWLVPAFSAEKAPARLELEYERESNPKKRVKLAIELSEARLKELRTAYESDSPERGTEAATTYLAAVERLGKAVREASNTGASKSAEIHLRRQGRELENLRMSLAFLDRPPIEHAAARVSQVREEILYSIMNPRRESANK